MKFSFAMQINIEVFNKLILSFSMRIARHAQSAQNNKFAYLCIIFRKMWRMKLIFCPQLDKKVFGKLIVLLWVCIARSAQGTKNNKFAIFLHCLKENLRDEVEILRANKCARFFQIDIIILGVCG